jgi:hypothetical protein
MTKMRFSIVASINTENPEAVRPVLERLVRKGRVTQMGEKEFRIEAEMEGEDAKELNRSLLSDLRRAARRTRLRADWTCGETTERFFDYVLKKSTKTATR